MVLTGTVLILAGLLLGLFGAHVARLKAWDRPRFTLGRAFTAGWRPARWVLLAAGFLCLALGSIPLFAAASVLFGLLWGWLLWTRSPRHALLRLRKELATLEALSPDALRPDLVCAILKRWHRDWAPEVVQQIVEENPALEDVARLVTRMERGWPV